MFEKFKTIKWQVNLIGLVMCLSLFGDLALFASLPVYHLQLGISVVSLGLVFSIHRLIRIPGNPIYGAVMGNYSRKPFFYLGVLFAILSTAGYGVANGLAQLVFFRILWGLAWIFIYLTSMAMVVDQTTQENRGRWMGTLNGWYLAGIAGGSFAGGFLVDLLGFRISMFLCAAFSLLALLILHRFIIETKQERFKFDADVMLPEIKRHFTGIIKGLGKTKQNGTIVLILVIYLIYQFAGEGVALSMLAYSLLERFGSSISVGWWVMGAATVSGLFLAFRYLFSALISPGIGSLSYYRSDGNRFMTTFAGLLIGAISFLLMAYGNQIGWVLFGIFLNAIGGAAMLVSLAAMIGDVSANDSGTNWLGVYAAAGDIGSSLGPLSGYLLLPILGVSSAFLFCSILFLVCSLVLVVFQKNLFRKVNARRLNE
ncbi:MAG: MFS transporter [Anaerolineaceae bacterium]|nr:MFS transporter [Anaerolineaceae bacterium]